MLEGGDRVILLSVRPTFADAILSGQKKAELRRSVPRVLPGSWALVYASAPVMAIVGVVRIETVQATTPQSLWHDVRTAASVSKHEYDTYYDRADKAAALWLAEPYRFAAAVPLAQLRREFDLEPPQSYRYLTGAQARALVAHDSDAICRLSLADGAAAANRPGRIARTWQRTAAIARRRHPLLFGSHGKSKTEKTVATNAQVDSLLT
jgi:predicted transcriptional regulator